MIYLKKFELLSETSENEIRTSLNLTYNSSYHFFVKFKRCFDL